MPLNDVNQERGDLLQVAIFHIVVPSADENAVVGLDYEVVAYVVDDDCLRQFPPKQRQVFN